MPSRYIWTPPSRDTEDPIQPPLPGMELKTPRITPSHPHYHQAGNHEVWGNLAHRDAQRHNPFIGNPYGDDEDEEADQERGRSWAHDYGGYADRYDHYEAPEHGPDRVERHVRNSIHKSLPGIAISSHALLRALDDGRVKSQFETNSSRGILSHEARADVEHQFFGYPHDLPARARPIYGFLTHNPAHAHEGVEHYGEHTLILHRPRIWHRTSAFIGDTLDDRYEGHMAHPVRDFKLSGVPSHVDPRHIRLDSTRWGDQTVPYAEAHFHGGVSLRDVHYAVLHKGGWYGDDDTSDLEHALNERKVPWVRMNKGHPEEWQHHLGAVNQAIARGAFSMPDSKVIGHQGHERYLIDLGYDNAGGNRQAQVADIRTGRLHRPASKDSILARGYWEEPSHPVELDEILPHVMPV